MHDAGDEETVVRGEAFYREITGGIHRVGLNRVDENTLG